MYIQPHLCWSIQGVLDEGCNENLNVCLTPTYTRNCTGLGKIMVEVETFYLSVLKLPEALVH